MAKVKNARSGEYIISCNAEGAIKVAKDYDNDKGALREVAEASGFKYDEGWNTRQFGKNIRADRHAVRHDIRHDNRIVSRQLIGDRHDLTVLRKRQAVLRNLRHGRKARHRQQR